MKDKAASVGLRFIAAALGLASDDNSRVEAQGEVEAMNAQFRAQEEARMRPVHDGLKVASELGRQLARELEKNAFMGALRGMGGAVSKGLGKVSPNIRFNAAAKAEGLAQPGLLTRMSPNARFNAAAKMNDVAPPMKPVPAAAPTAPKASKPLIGWKGKALAAGAIGATGYAGFKGLQTARDFMLTPGHQTHNWGAGGPQPRAGVNEYGQPSF